MSRRAIIVGGSIGGLFCANLLERSGWAVTILERTPHSLSSRGAGTVTHPELYAALRSAGIDGRSIFGVDVDRRKLFDRRDGVTREIAFPQRLATWGQVYAALRSGLRTSVLREGRSLIDVEQDALQVAGLLDNGERLTADVLIGADGIRSTVRRLILPGEEPVYAGYVGWRGLVDETDLSAATGEALLSSFSFDFPPGEQIVGYPVAQPHATRAGLPLHWNYVWYRPVPEDAALDAMLTGTDGQLYHDGIPPMLLRPEILDRMRRDAVALLAPPIAEAVCGTRQPILQPIYDLLSTRLAVGRIALIGDAAFVARPHCGMGVTKAGSDAVALSQSLASADDVPEALAEYERRRRSIGQALVRHAQELGNTIDSDAAAGSLPAPIARQEELMETIAVAWDEDATPQGAPVS